MEAIVAPRPGMTHTAGSVGPSTGLPARLPCAGRAAVRGPGCGARAGLQLAGRRTPRGPCRARETKPNPRAGPGARVTTAEPSRTARGMPVLPAPSALSAGPTPTRGPAYSPRPLQEPQTQTRPATPKPNPRTGAAARVTTAEPSRTARGMPVLPAPSALSAAPPPARGPAYSPRPLQEPRTRTHPATPKPNLRGPRHHHRTPPTARGMPVLPAPQRPVRGPTSSSRAGVLSAAPAGTANPNPPRDTATQPAGPHFHSVQAEVIRKRVTIATLQSKNCFRLQ